MRFQVPQFIDVEDRIFGPFTFKQFIYLAGGAMVGVAATSFLGLFLGLLVSSPIIVLALALAFYKVNNRPFINTLESAFKYLLGNKLYVWKKFEDDVVKEAEEKSNSSLVLPSLSGSKLRDMNWELDVKRKEEAKSLELKER